MTKKEGFPPGMSEIYLDYNATTPVAKPVQLEYARAQVASLLNADPTEILFTSGGTESNNTVIMGMGRAMSGKGRHVITTRIEHPSLMNPCLHLLEQGWNVSFIKVNSQGVVDPLVHTDAAQAVGKIPVDVKNLGADYLSIAGHKLYAPKGIGALYCRKGAPLGQLMFGAGQERGLRPGTEPVPLAVGLGAACDFVARGMKAEAERETGLREKLYAELSKLDHPIIRHCDPENTIPNTLSISFIGKNGAKILARAPEIMASTGSACHDRDIKVSYVLAAMGVSPEVAMGTLRLTLGRGTTESDIEIAAQAIGRAL
jgi:cysteine desulfurase